MAKLECPRAHPSMCMHEKVVRLYVCAPPSVREFGRMSVSLWPKMCVLEYTPTEYILACWMSAGVTSSRHYSRRMLGAEYVQDLRHHRSSIPSTTID